MLKSKFMWGSEELINRIRNYKGTYDDFVSIHEIAKSLWWWQRWGLPEFRVWNTAVLYDFLGRPDCVTNLGYHEADVICQFKQNEAEILSHLEQNRDDPYWQSMLQYLILGHQDETYDKYREISIP